MKWHKKHAKYNLFHLALLKPNLDLKVEQIN